MEARQHSSLETAVLEPALPVLTEPRRDRTKKTPEDHPGEWVCHGGSPRALGGQPTSLSVSSGVTALNALRVAMCSGRGSRPYFGGFSVFSMLL